jgi:hypothetical protein
MLKVLAECLLIVSTISQADIQKVKHTPHVFAVLVKE